MNTKEMEAIIDRNQRELLSISQEMDALKERKRICESMIAMYTKYMKRSAKIDADTEKRRLALEEEMSRELPSKPEFSLMESDHVTGN